MADGTSAGKAVSEFKKENPNNWSVAFSKDKVILFNLISF
jgi:hypothetical protein